MERYVTEPQFRKRTLAVSKKWRSKNKGYMKEYWIKNPKQYKKHIKRTTENNRKRNK